MTTRLQAQHKKKAFLISFAKCGNISQSAKDAKIDRITVYDWKRDDPEFLAAYEHAEEDAADALEEEARRRAIKGSDLLLIFMLKGAKPEKYRERGSYEHTGPNRGPIQVQRIDLTKLSDEELDTLDRLVDKGTTTAAATLASHIEGGD